MQHLHRERAVGIGLAGERDRGLWPAPVIGVVHERGTHALDAVEPAHLEVALEADEIEAGLLDQVRQRDVAAHLEVPLLGRQLDAVERDGGHPTLDPLARGLHFLGGNQRGAPEDLGLVHVIDIHAELLLPALGRRRARAHPDAAPADEPVHLPAQPGGGGRGAQERQHARSRRRVVHVHPEAFMADADSG